MPDDDDKLSPRVAALETNYARLHEDVQELGADVRGVKTEMQRGFGELRQLIRESEIQQRQAHQPQWNVMLQALSVTVTIIIAIGGLAWWPVMTVASTNASAIKDASPRLAKVEQQFVDLRQYARDLDTNLQREMRDLDRQQSLEIKAVRRGLEDHRHLGIHPGASERVSRIEGKLGLD